MTFGAQLCVQMRRIEGPNSPLAYTQLGMAALGSLLFIYPAYFWLAAAYRPHSPEMSQTLNEFGLASS